MLLLLLLPLVQAAYQPGSPGVAWTEEQAAILGEKLVRLYNGNIREIITDFDLGTESATSSGYMFDPELTTVVPPYDECTSVEECDTFMTPKRRLGNLAFTEKKALRLAFHDCIPYVGGEREGGCDGCLNLEQNRKGNQGLQGTVAVLERLYKDVDFPKKKGAPLPNLSMSPHDLGMSRADLWAFAGLVALDVMQQKTRHLCTARPISAMCGDLSTACFTPFSQQGLAMFRTGRVDCMPSDSASPLQQYLASGLEDHPDDNGNGAMTTNYYDKAFGFTGREGLALMGAHTVGQMFPVWSRNNYGWTNEMQNNLFNNKFYKMLAQRSSKVKDECIGTMADQPATALWTVIANVHTNKWKAPETWASPQEAGHIRWSMEYQRGPACVNPPPEEGDRDRAGPWGRRNITTMCCETKAAGCAAEGTCDTRCTRKAGNLERAIGPDVGYYLKWQVDDQGLPYGCDGFNNRKTGERLTHEEFRTSGRMGAAECPKQDLDDGHGQELWRTVEDFADSQELWMEEFTAVFEKMQSNGYQEGGLAQGPANFWTHN